MFNHPFDLFLFSSSFLSLLMGITILTMPIGKTWGKTFGLLLLTIGLIHFRFLLIKHHVAIWSPAKFLGYFSLFYLLGPFATIAIKRQIVKNYQFDFRQVLLFVPFVLAVGVDISLIIKTPDEQAEVVRHIFTSGLGALSYQLPERRNLQLKQQ